MLQSPFLRDIGLLHGKMGISSDEKILVASGRVTQAKGIPNLLNAFVNIVKQYSNCRLVIIGPLYDVALVLNRSKSIASKISYTGLINKKGLNDWYRVADIGVIPSFSEQCSYTGIEMMMNGLPVVASDGFGVRSMFRGGVNAQVAKIGNWEKPKEFETNLTEAILELLFSVELRENLGKAARQAYESSYTTDKMSAGYKKLI